jgi:hypothetical protein
MLKRKNRSLGKIRKTPQTDLLVNNAQAIKTKTLLRTKVPWVQEIEDLLEIQDGAVKIMSSNYFFFLHNPPGT